MSWTSLQKRLATTGLSNLVKVVCFAPFLFAGGLAGWSIYLWTQERNTTDVANCRASTITGLLMADGIIMLVCIAISFLALLVNVICLLFISILSILFKNTSGLCSHYHFYQEIEETWSVGFLHLSL